MLRNKIKESAERVKKYRTSIPGKICEATKEQIQKSSKLLEEAIEEEEQSSKESQVEQGNTSALSKNKDIFLAETTNIALKVEALRKKIPDQIREGRSTVRVCQEWARKPISEAEAVLAEELKVCSLTPPACRNVCAGNTDERGGEKQASQCHRTAHSVYSHRQQPPSLISIKNIACKIIIIALNAFLLEN